MANASELLAQFAKLPIGSGVSHWRAQPVQSGPTIKDVLKDTYVQAAAKDSEQPYDAQFYDANPLNTGVAEALGGAEYRRDRYARRSDGEVVGDTLPSVISGFGGAVGGIAALGVGLVSDRGGAAVSEFVGDGVRYIQDQQSDGLNLRRKANAGRSAASEQDNNARFKSDLDTRGDFVANLRRIGREAISGIGNAADDPTMLVDGMVNAVGSLLLGGPASKAGIAVGGSALRGLLGRGVISEAVALKAAQVGRSAAMPATIGTMEASGAYQ